MGWTVYCVNGVWRCLYEDSSETCPTLFSYPNLQYGIPTGTDGDRKIHISMKKLFFQSKVFSLLMTMVVAIGVSACSSNDDSEGNEGGLGEIPNLPTPEFESVSAKYEITQSNSEIASIELTASGDYIVLPKNSYFGAPSKRTEKISVISNSGSLMRASRAFNGGPICGKFIKISDTEFILENFGSIVIEGSGSNAFSLQISPSDGETTTVSARKSSELPDSPINDAICRTWNLNELGVKLLFNNTQIYNGTKPASQMDVLMKEANDAFANFMIKNFGAEADEFEPYEPYGFYPLSIIMTKSGTYMVTYSNGALAVATWSWVNEDKGQFRFSWDYDNPDSVESGVGGAENYASFKGESLIVRELHSETEDGATFSTETRYICSMAK